MHPCLCIPEIRLEIAHAIHPGGWHSGQGRALLSLALTSSFFFEPCMNVLWERIDIRPLLNCLPPELIRDTPGDGSTIRIPTQLDTLRFRSYAARVRHFTYARIPNMNKDLYRTIVLLLNGCLILPNVHTVFISDPCPDTIPFLTNILHPGVHVLSLRLRGDDFYSRRGYHRLSYATLLSSLSQLSSLVSLELALTNPQETNAIGLIEEIVRTSFPPLATLERLTLKPFPLSRVGWIASLPTLRELAVELVPSSTGHSLPIGKSCIRGLQKLDIQTVRPDEALGLLQALEAQLPILSIRINIESAVETVGPLHEIIREIALKVQSSTLKSLVIAELYTDEYLDEYPEEDPEWGILQYTFDISHMQPLLKFKHLTELSLRCSGIMDLDDDAMWNIGGSFIQLNSLTLRGQYGTNLVPRTTLTSLLHLARHCANLTHLNFAFSAYNLPTEKLYDKHMCPKLDFLKVQYSPIGSIGPVAAFLSDIFPSLHSIEAYPYEGLSEWGEVAKLVPEFTRVRDEERTRAAEAYSLDSVISDMISDEYNITGRICRRVPAAYPGTALTTTSLISTKGNIHLVHADKGRAFMSSDESINEDHPFVAELASLKKAVVQFQDEAHHASLKLQRQSLDLSNAYDRVTYYERQNEALENELAALRANPHPESLPQAHPAVYQSQQLTLSLRRLSDKLSLTEQALLEKTTELTSVTGEVAKAKLAEDNAYALASRIRGREEAGKSRELELEMKVKAAEEATKMSDLVVQEYADLVRSLQGNLRSPRQTNGSAHAKSFSVSSDPHASQPDTPLRSLAEGKAGLQRLVAEFSSASEKVETELARVQGELSETESKLDAERKALEQSRQELARTRFELQQLKLEDNTAAKMVSRYMTFSQKSTDTLQEAIATLKTRHTATTDSLSEQISNIADQLHFSERQTEKLRQALDELGGELMKETYGRRREVALRIRMVGREEKLREDLEKWVLKAEEALARNPEDLRPSYENMITNIRRVLDHGFGGVSADSTGAVARITVAENAVELLMKELESERAKRVQLANLLSQRSLPPTTEETNVDLTSPTRETPLRLQKPLPPDPKPSSPVIPPPTAANAADSMTAPPAAISLEQEASPEPTLVPTEDHAVVPSPSSPPPSTDDAALSPLPQEADLPTQLPEVVDEQPLSPVTAASPVGDVELVEDHHVSEPAAQKVEERPEAITENDTEQVYDTKTERTEELVSDSSRREEEAEVAGMLLEGDAPSNGSPLKAISGVGEAPTGAQGPSSVSEPSEHQEHGQVQQSLEPPPDTQSSTTNPDIPSLLLTDADADQENKISIPPITILDSPTEAPLKIPTSLPHPLLADLAQTSHRYDELQRGFRDCHRSLESLKEDLKSPPSSQVDPEILQAAAKRLTEWNEDARVELEIRAADEELVARGYEALLSIPGALASPGLAPLPSARTSALLGEDVDQTPNVNEVETQVRAFISGDDPVVRKAYLDLSQKLADIEHDIAVLKRSMHDDVAPSPPPPPALEPPQSSGWTSWIRSSPSTPSGLNTPPALGSASGPVPTFGNIMSSPRLRHSPSLTLQPQQRKVSGNNNADPFASLGLKVPMPIHLQQRVPSGGSNPQRPRTISSMYMLGLGARSSTGAFGSPSPRGAFTPSRKSPFSVVSPLLRGEQDDDNDSDVE